MESARAMRSGRGPPLAFWIMTRVEKMLRLIPAAKMIQPNTVAMPKPLPMMRAPMKSAAREVKNAGERFLMSIFPWAWVLVVFEDAAVRVSFNGRACFWELYKASLNTETGGLWGGSCRGCSDQTPKAISAPTDRGTSAKEGFRSSFE